MAKPEFCLFYHPTTTVYIDDNKDFLNALTTTLSPGSFKTFTDPHEGLVFVESQFKLSENFTAGVPTAAESAASNTLLLPQSHICQKLKTINRFSEPSVVIVDFSMPDLNGLDLCAEISDPNCKKVLLTGVANEKQAIHALNSELIDFYIDKNEEDLPKKLDAIIKTLNFRYFNDMMTISNNEAKLQTPYIYETSFADYFEQLCEDSGVIEYYYVTNPDGFLLIDKSGAMSRLVVMTSNALTNAIALAKSQGASSDCLKALSEKKLIPFFQNGDSEFEPHFLEEWQQYVHPIHLVDAGEQYLCGLIKGRFKSPTNYQDYIDMPSNRLH